MIYELGAIELQRTLVSFCYCVNISAFQNVIVWGLQLFHTLPGPRQQLHFCMSKTPLLGCKELIYHLVSLQNSTLRCSDYSDFAIMQCIYHLHNKFSMVWKIFHNNKNLQNIGGDRLSSKISLKYMLRNKQLHLILIEKFIYCFKDAIIC